MGWRLEGVVGQGGRRVTLQSLPEEYRAAVFGASGGLGSAFTRALCADGRCAEVFAGSRSQICPSVGKVRGFHFDLQEEDSIRTAVEQFASQGPLHLVVVATGMLHDASTRPEKTWAALAPESLQRAFVVNAVGPALIAKHTLNRLARSGKSVFIALSARVGSISDNRLGGWHSYRASKGALNMLLRNFAIELAMRNRSAICAGLHPGTVRTALSQPFLGESSATRVFTPEQSVARLLEVIDSLSPGHSGRLFAWDGSEIPF